MKYVILLAMDPDEWNGATPDQQEAWLADHGRFDTFIVDHGAIHAGEALDVAATATTVRHRGGEVVVSDGPYVELVEQLGGFYVVELPNLDLAIEAAQLLPDCYAVEIRPVIAM